MPDYNLSAEQIEFRDTLRRFFEAASPMSLTRGTLAADRGVDAALWKSACDKLALPGLAIAEEYGGQGFGLAELAIAFSESGRALAPMPLLSVAGFAARSIEAVSRPEDRGEWLEPIASGQIATLAWVDASGRWAPESTTTVVVTGGRISGKMSFVLDGDVAERFLVVARIEESHGDEGLGLYSVEADARGLSVRRLETLDLTRRMFSLTLENVEARRISGSEGSGAALRSALDDVRVLLCAEMAGGMERVLETAVDYAKTRHQFGRPIGSFQAIKHKAADMLIDFESARTATAAAIEAVDRDAADRSLAVAVAKAFAGAAYVRMTTEAIQILGGVGYTWEYDAHLYFRRAQASSILLGDASEHHERIARELSARVARVTQEASHET